MSFSIPSAEDIGPAPILSMEQLDGLLSLGGDQSAGGERFATRAPPTLGGRAPPMGEGALGEARKRTGRGSFEQSAKTPVLSWQTLDSAGSSASGAASSQLANSKLTNVGHRSPLADAIGDTSAKRDVVSVSQCCNMMETEDVSFALWPARERESQALTGSARARQTDFQG